MGLWSQGCLGSHLCLWLSHGDRRLRSPYRLGRSVPMSPGQCGVRDEWRGGAGDLWDRARTAAGRDAGCHCCGKRLVRGLSTTGTRADGLTWATLSPVVVMTGRPLASSVGAGLQLHIPQRPGRLHRERPGPCVCSAGGRAGSASGLWERPEPPTLSAEGRGEAEAGLHRVSQLTRRWVLHKVRAGGGGPRQ